MVLFLVAEDNISDQISAGKGGNFFLSVNILHPRGNKSVLLVNHLMRCVQPIACRGKSYPKFQPQRVDGCQEKSAF